MTTPRVKVCGITSAEDAECAASAGADAIGLVFYPPSSRYIEDLAKAKEIAQSVGPFVTVVGLFVDASPQIIEQTLASVPLHLLQFHGNETAQQCERYSRPYMKAFRMKEGFDFLHHAAEHPKAQGFLLDTYVKGVPGGTGEVFDWRRFPRNCDRRVVLAGGLHPDNVKDAVMQTEPYGVDVSGGVESAPGIKDKEKVTAFISQAKLEL